jgi:hypothetical protein
MAMEGPRTGPGESEPGVGGLSYEVNLKGRGMGHPFVVFEGKKGPCCSTLQFTEQVYTAVRHGFTRIFVASEHVTV